MGRYLVTMESPPAPLEECEKCGPFWKEALSEYGDVTPLRDFANISEGRYVGVFEAPSADRVRALFDGFDRKIKASGLFPTAPEGQCALDIWAIEFETDGTNIVYQAEPARA